MFCSPLPHWAQPRQRNSLPQPGYRKEAAGPGCTSGSFRAFPAAANSVRAQNALPSMERGVVHKMHGQEALDCKAFPHNFSLQLFRSNSIYRHSLLFFTPAGRIVCPDYLGDVLLDWATCPGDSVMPVMPFNLIYPSNISRRCTDSCPHFCEGVSLNVQFCTFHWNKIAAPLCFLLPNFARWIPPFSRPHMLELHTFWLEKLNISVSVMWIRVDR